MPEPRAWSCRAVARFGHLVIAASFLFVGPPPLYAQSNEQTPPAPPPNIAAFATLTGNCQKLVVGGEDLSAKCADALLNVGYRNGNSSFMLSATGVLAISFFGADAKAMGDRATLHVHQVTITREGEPPKPVALPATGSCDYTNPYAGPSHVTCTATAAGRTYSAQFVSDGKPPKVDRFDQ